MSKSSSSILRPKSAELDGRSLRNAFALSAIVGIAIIVLVSVLQINVLWGMGLAVIPMLIYWLHFHQGGEPASFKDTFSDSIYYLGFVLTITAMITAMVRFGITVERLSAQAVLAQFGIAMVTTLIGLCVRVYYKQFDLTVEAAQLFAKESLDKSVREFNIQMRTVNESLERLTSAVDQTINDTEERNVKSVETLQKSIHRIEQLGEEAAGKFAEKLASTTEGALDSLDEYSRESLKEIKATANESLRTNNAFAAAGIKTINEGLVSGAEASLTIIKNALNETITYSSQLQSSIKELDKSIVAFNRHISKTDQVYMKNVDQTISLIDSLNAESNRVFKIQSNLEVSMERILESVDLATTKLDNLGPQGLNSIAGVLENYYHATESFRALVKDAGLTEILHKEKDLADALETHRKELDIFSKNRRGRNTTDG